MTRYLEQKPALTDHVHLRGRASFSEMEMIYNSADLLLQASLREFSGCAVLEAMACGVVPVVTDIPSFRAMTGGGRSGGLFPVGDPEVLAREVLSYCQDSFRDHSAAVRADFERALSFSHMAERMETIYRDVLAGERATVAAVAGAS